MSGMSEMGGKIDSIAALKRVILALNLEDDLAFEDPNAFILIVPMQWVDCAGDIVPSKGVIAFAVQVSFDLGFRKGHRP